MAEWEAEATRADPGADSSGRSSDPFIGRVLNGRFHVLKRIAQGGMGSVYFATQSPLGRPVAVKVLHVFREDDDSEPEESFRGRFLQEASMLAKLQHPNIVMLLDYGQIAGTQDYFMAMEFLRGDTLAARFKARGRLRIAESISLARQIGRGLREAHRCGFIHRDLKPSNIMLVPDDEGSDIVKLVDFGIGKVLPGRAEGIRCAAEETRAGILLGSPRYMAPEQIRSEPVEPRTDLYGLGVILFQALTGRLPFDGPSFDLLLAHCVSPPPRISELCPDQAYPEGLSCLVASLLEKEVAARPTTDEFLRRLAEIEEEMLAGPATTTGPVHRSGAIAVGGRAEASSLRPPARRGWRTPVLALGAAGVCAIAAAIPHLRSADRSGRPDARPKPPSLTALAPAPAAGETRATPEPGETASSSTGSAAPGTESAVAREDGVSGSTSPAGRAGLAPAASTRSGAPSSSRAGAPVRSRAGHNPGPQPAIGLHTESDGLDIRLRR